VTFLGVDLAWRADNPSGVARLAGRSFPLRLLEPPAILAGHGMVLEWIARHVRAEPSIVGIDAPLLGLRAGRRRRRCDDAIARAFGRFHASTHSPAAYPDLRHFARALVATHGLPSFAPGLRPRRGAPVIREVYPNALQVLLFRLDRRRRARIVAYKRRRFGTKDRWAREGLARFAGRCARAIGGRYVRQGDAGWVALLAHRPRAALSAGRLKAIEDRWDAVLCALAVGLEYLAPGTMRLYPPDSWQRGAILAPGLGERAWKGR
jgi:predicted RNase H-like nuclease